MQIEMQIRMITLAGCFIGTNPVEMPIFLFFFVFFFQVFHRFLTGCSAQSDCRAVWLHSPPFSFLCFDCSSWAQGVGGRVWPEFCATLLPGVHHPSHGGHVSSAARRLAAHLWQQWVGNTTLNCLCASYWLTKAKIKRERKLKFSKSSFT